MLLFRSFKKLIFVDDVFKSNVFKLSSGFLLVYREILRKGIFILFKL